MSTVSLITHNAETDADIINILLGTEQSLPGLEPNRDAAAKMEEYLEVQFRKNLPTSMADVQSRYQAIPYGWREIDIAAVAARLIFEQKVTIKYAGNTIQPNNPKLPDMLRKKSEIGRTSISKRQVVSIAKMKEVKEFLREYFDVMDVPDDEDGLIAFIIDRFTRQKAHYEELNARYDGGKKYPDRPLVQKAITLMDDVLSQQKDNIALIERVIKKQDDLFDNKEQMQRVEGFFKNQVTVFDAAVKLERDLSHELDYLSHEPEANTALNQIRLICVLGTGGKFDYKRIPELNGLMDKVHEGHDKLLAAKREELLEIVRQCMEAIHTSGMGGEFKNIISVADNFYDQKKQQIADLRSLALLDGLLPPMLQYKDDTVDKLEMAKRPPVIPPKPPVDNKPGGTITPPAPKKVYKSLNRSIVFPAKRLESEAEIDDYVEKMRESLKQLLKNCDGIHLK